MQVDTTLSYERSSAVSGIDTLLDVPIGSGEATRDEAPEITEWSGQSLATSSAAFVYATWMMMAIAGPSAAAHNLDAFGAHLPEGAIAVDKVPQERHELETGHTSLQLQAFRRGESELLTALEANPVEDGQTHAAEHILAQMLANHEMATGAWVLRAVKGEVPGAEASAMLRLLARFSPFDADRRVHLVKIGLASQHVEVRDAAMQAVENWREVTSIEALRNHRDEISWLRDYAKQILRDLSEQ